jgi:integrase
MAAGKVIKRKGRNYVADWYDAGGRRRRKSFGKRKDAESFLEGEKQTRKAVESGQVILKESTFGEYAPAWLERHCPNLKPSTFNSYRANLKTHLIPRFEDLDLRAIDHEKIDTFKAFMFKRGKHANQTINHNLKILKKLLGDALLDGYLSLNPALTVKALPLLKEEIDFLDPDELNLLLDKSRGVYRTLFLAAMLSGMRRGEALAVRHTDLDYASAQIHIQRTLYRGTFTAPKSKASRRKIDMPPALVDALKELPSRFRGDLVFCQPNGKHLHAENMVRREFNPALKRAGLRHVKFHSLRHSYAVMLIESGVNVKYLQRQLGHASIKMTLDTYGHLFRDTNPEASKGLQEIFERGQGGHISDTKKAAGNSGGPPAM